MQVKKFEAKTMKEALDLVKVHLGPEAIILSARDTHRGFGLMGDKSVEVTAAVSEETLRKKKIAETKLREDLRRRFQQIPASKQKQFINKVFSEGREERLAHAGGPVAAVSTVSPATAVSAEVRAQVKGMRYIDIEDEQAFAPPRPAQRAVRDLQIEADQAPAAPSRRSARVSAAAAAAASAARATFSAAKPAVPPSAPPAEMHALESQVRELKALVERFQRMPQVPLSMHPGAEQGLPYELSGIYQRLIGQGLQPPLVSEILRKAQKELDADTLKKPALVDAWAVRHFLGRVEVAAQPTSSRYHVFLGSTGQGKTTTLVKLASHLMLKEKRRIAMISLDTMKLGATDQLRLFAQILNVPFAVVRNPEEWQTAEARLAGVQHILVDAPGLSLRSQDEIAWLRRMLPPASLGKTTHFVQSILAREEETGEIATRYQSIGFDDVIFTRLDESARQGLMIDFQDRFKVPLHSFGFGPRIPEDLELATKERVVDLLFKLSKTARREESL
jgi:flagellar biosynthesis protein FlhF